MDNTVAHHSLTNAHHRAAIRPSWTNSSVYILSMFYFMEYPFGPGWVSCPGTVPSQCLVPLVTGRAGESGKSWFRISTAQQQLNHYFLFKAEYCNSYKKENYPRWNQDKGRHFWWRVWWSAKRLAREVTDIPSLETIKIRLDGAVGRLNMMTFNCPS